MRIILSPTDSALSSQRVSLVISEVSGGGAEKSMSEIGEYLRSSGFEVQIIAINKSHNDSRPNHPHDRCLERDPRSPFKGMFSLVRLFRRELKSFDPDAVVLNCEVSELFGVFSPSQRLIVVEHTTRPWVGRTGVGFLVRLALALRRVQWVTVVRDQKFSWPSRQRCTHIPNPVQESNEFPKSGSDLVFIGRLTNSKHPEMLERLSRLRGYSVDFFGDGAMLRELKSSSSPKMRFFGFIEHPWRFVWRNSLIVFPSEYEGDGKGVVEAILRGNPLLLQDNEDLRRFQLPDMNYFKDFSELEEKTKDALQGNLDLYRAPDSMRQKLRAERSLEVVGSRWVREIKKYSKA